MITLGILVLLFFFLAVGVPVAFSMAASGAAGLYILGGWDVLLGVLQSSPLTTVSVYELITIPLFLLMAELVMMSGVADDMFTCLAAWVGRIRGGLGMATAMFGAAFGAMCGTSTATAAALSTTSLPAMLKQGYEPRMASGVVAISGTLAMLVPPSVALIIFGLIAEVNIGALFVGGLIPAILVAITIMATVWFLAWKNPDHAPLGPKLTWREKIGHLKVVGPMLVLFALVGGTIYSGLGTPTEASAIGATGALCIGLAKGKLTWETFYTAVKKASRTSCMICMILLGAGIFTYFFALTHITQDLIHWVGQLPTSRWVIIFFLLCGYIVLGAFMDQIAILVLTVPVVVPLIKSLGFDPIWFGLIKMVTAEVGMITPPIGLNCFIVSRYANRPASEVFKGTRPHFAAHLIVITVLVAFPDIIMWLPRLMAK